MKDVSNFRANFEVPSIDRKIGIPNSLLIQLEEQQNRVQQIVAPLAEIAKLPDSIAHIGEPSRKISETLSSINHLPSVESFQVASDALVAYNNPMSENLLSISKTIENSLPQIDVSAFSQSIINMTNSFEKQAFNLSSVICQGLELSIPKYEEMAINLTRAIEVSIPKFNAIGDMVLRFADTIPRIDESIKSLAQQVAGVVDSVNESFRLSVTALIDCIDKIKLPDFNHISTYFSYISDFEEKNELLKSFGWFLISELPEELVDEIYSRKDEITQEDVDSIIIKHFRENKCQALKNIVMNWNGLSYFESRKEVFHEAQKCHSLRAFNASTALISIHYEGVVTDFVRGRNLSTYRVDKALQRINNMMDEVDFTAMSFEDWIVCSYVLECLDQAFTTNFSPSDPDSCPDYSRHKIAHGHVTSKETEANSLRHFLFMNELYKLFRCLDHELPLAS